MDLVWEDPPVPEGPFFTRDSYDKYSLAPNIRELWASLQSPIKNSNAKQEDVSAVKVSCSTSKEEAAEFKDNSHINKIKSCLDSCDHEDMSVDSVENEADDAFPDPRLPYPCLSSLSSIQSRTYLNYLMSKNTKAPPSQALQTRVNAEVMEFTRYLQNVAKVCADDYNFISNGAMQHSEEFFRACLECIMTYPQLYQIHEMTSLAGGTYNPGLTLTFEKQLLIMGNVDITDHKIVPADAQLAWDYQSVSSENPPAKKAKDMHATISSDSNAKTLSDRYEPHVCLTRDALVRLLDNHDPDFGERWELPVWVKCNQMKGSSQKKTVYVDSPLLKPEMTVRERSHFFHEESLKLSIMKNGSQNVFHVMTELPTGKQQLPLENSRRDLVSFESGLDFDVDLTDLETFGETTPSKISKMQMTQTEQDTLITCKKACSPLSKTKSSSSSSHKDTNTSLAEVNDHTTEEIIQPAVCEVTEPQIEHMTMNSVQGGDKDFAVDSDDEKLVIDDAVSCVSTPTNQDQPRTLPSSAESPVTPVSEAEPVNSESLSPQRGMRKKRQPKRTKVSGDQLGEILRMQTAMFNTANDSAKHSAISQVKPPTQCTEPQVYSHPTSLVKPCVTSYLERNQNQDRETCSLPQKSTPVDKFPSTEHRKILSEDLQASAEDERDYEPPEEGNLLYKLYSLQDMLLMVRSSVSLCHTRNVGCTQNKFVPVHVLPKLEYQLCYGVECLSSSEACQLWTETMLHSSTVSYIAHIDAFTSKVALLRKLPDAWKQNISCGFKPSKSLNILHHLLKKLTGLEEGQYLLTHEAGNPFVTILKAATGKVIRGSYNLHQIHSAVPQPPASGIIPWIPVDPAVVLPFHLKHGRVPCTFPLTPIIKKVKNGPSQTNSQGAGQMNQNRNAGACRVSQKRSWTCTRKKADKNDFTQENTVMFTLTVKAF
ncbi:little elongation complex subunit 2 isoform X2 [Cheilinus undulatus]|uniref:little elongation complex subunit 2 isoform X2 n=1 Tax=Cheilinus undulatus TaxID=241271 RepID=UPI001BD4FFB5|nr:little elongation complex subunit 2 isoform X2 [Cheilinus undulatus]